MNDNDTLPWYRQFWPWFLILLPASAVVASLYTVTLAYRTTDSLVTASDDGMDVVTERHIAAERAAAALGLSAAVDIDSRSGAINAVLSSTTEQEWPQILELLFSHPTIAGRDRTITLTAAMPNAQGKPAWSGHLVTVPDGRWYVVLSPPEAAGSHWRLNGTWQGEAAIRLVPAGGAGDERT